MLQLIYHKVIRINTHYTFGYLETSPLPPPLVIHYILENVIVNRIIMSSSDELALADKVKSVDHIIGSMEGTDDLSIVHEIECPRCHDTMILYSEFNKLCYLCEECGFCLALST